MTILRNTAMWLIVSAAFLLAAAAFTIVGWQVAPDAHSSKHTGTELVCLNRLTTAHDRAQDQIILAYMHQDDTALSVASDSLADALHDLDQAEQLCR